MGYTQGTAFVDGELVPISEAKISLRDWNFLHSNATCEIATKYQGCWLAPVYMNLDGKRMNIKNLQLLRLLDILLSVELNALGGTILIGIMSLIYTILDILL